ncbi:MAG TPA: DUF3090 family protein [Ktedonobacteraceae bacterium]|jgi:uncharacterized repeat protein (TIGR03847 family)|nr:DUF3090 family protein [Ktedonobacteraceae bacterium]
MSTDLGLVDVLGAEAVGQPGQRRFRLFALSNAGSVIMWLEKEQLQNLSLAIDRALAQITEGTILRTIAQAEPPPEEEGGMPPTFPNTPSFEFQVGQIRLGFDEGRNLLALIVSPLEIVLERGRDPVAIIREEESVSIFFTLQQAHSLTNAITSLMTRGRPVCPLCNTPLDGGPHACVKQNGHREIVQVIEEMDGEEEE